MGTAEAGRRGLREHASYLLRNNPLMLPRPLRGAGAGVEDAPPKNAEQARLRQGGEHLGRRVDSRRTRRRRRPSI